MSTMYHYEKDITLPIAYAAGKAILSFYTASMKVTIKEDDSPVTEADLAANAIILAGLQQAFPNDGYLTEETDDNLDRLTKSRVWIIDPLDGTASYVHMTGQFTVNIALAVDHEIVFSVVYAPAVDELYYAIKGEGAYLVKDGQEQRLHVNDKNERYTFLSSQFHISKKDESYRLDKASLIDHIQVMGSSMKPCYIARGLAEVAVKIGPGTKEWDIAAPSLVLQEAGGVFVKPNGEPFRYNQPDVFNHWGYLAMNWLDPKMLVTTK